MGLYRRFGFREVGRYREQGMLDGEWVDTVVMELLLGEASGTRVESAEVVMDKDWRTRVLEERAGAYARVALANIGREYPYQMVDVVTGPGPRSGPRERHPAFYGSYDWHSCVEMHWTLVRLLRVVPGAVPGEAIRAALDEHLSSEALVGEAAFFADPAYRFVADFSVYVEREARGTGVGRALLGALIEEARRLGYHKMVLAAFPFNEAGMALYRRFGFREVGRYREQGMLDGKWVDTVVMELLLGEA